MVVPSSKAWSRAVVRHLLSDRLGTLALTTLPGAAIALAYFGHHGAAAMAAGGVAGVVLARWNSPLLVGAYGDAELKFILGRRLNHGHGLRCDPVAARRWYQEAAGEGHGGAALALATLLAFGPSEVRDQAAGAAALRTLAERGDGAAMVNLAGLLRDGEDVVRDPAEAMRWYVRAVEARVPSAMTTLGFIHATGEGVPEDFEAARGLWLQAADLGDADAAENLGEIFARGCGVAQDPIAALTWYRIALALGGTLAEQSSPYYEGLLTTLDDDAKRRAEAAAHEWLDAAARKKRAPTPRA